MILSMTGFAATTHKMQGGILSVELRAVNHRYLDIQIRLPEDLRAIESAIREQISGRVSRGKIDCKICLTPLEQDDCKPSINQKLISELLMLANEVQRHDKNIKPLSTAEILAWPGILCQQEIPVEISHQTIIAILPKVLDEFIASKMREGEKLKLILLRLSAEMAEIVQNIQPKLAQILDIYLKKLSERLREAVTNINDDRLQQEFTLFAQKIDIEEELQRLNTHLSELCRILVQGGPSGKRLDFLMQELNREANTLGSKSVSSETTQAAMELKIRIEQMREQIQNIE